MWYVFFRHLYIYSFESPRTALLANVQGSFIMEPTENLQPTSPTTVLKKARLTRKAAVKADGKIRAVRDWENLFKNSKNLEKVQVYDADTGRL